MTFANDGHDSQSNGPLYPELCRELIAHSQHLVMFLVLTHTHYPHSPTLTHTHTHPHKIRAFHIDRHVIFKHKLAVEYLTPFHYLPLTPSLPTSSQTDLDLDLDLPLANSDKANNTSRDDGRDDGGDLHDLRAKNPGRERGRGRFHQSSRGTLGSQVSGSI